MKHITRHDIEQMERIPRLDLINSIPGFKAANLVGTTDEDGNHNVAVFSSVVHLGSSPALLGMVTRPTRVTRHTYDNIVATKCYTINHIHSAMSEQAHYTSAKFDKGVSEFEGLGLRPQLLGECKAPFVGESRVKIGMQLEEIIDLPNDTKLIIGSIQDIYLDDERVQRSDGSIDLQAAGTVAISGLYGYHRTQEPIRYPYARVSEIPEHLKETKRRPDSVVYDEKTGSYNAALLPYATDQGAPSIIPNDLTLWKKTGASKISHHLKAKYDEIRRQYEDMKTLYSWNEIVYQARFGFEPVLGETYHLYRDSKDELFLSMITPETWKKEHLGAFRLNADQIWERLDVED